MAKRNKQRMKNNNKKDDMDLTKSEKKKLAKIKHKTSEPKKQRVKLDDMINHKATDKQIKFIEDLCKDNGYDFYNKNINMKHASSIIAFLAYDKVEPHYLFDYVRYE